MKTAKIYFPDEVENEATLYYVHLISQALSSHFIVEIVKSASTIFSGDTVIVISPLNFFYLNIKFRDITFICWFQGIGPEEYRLLHPEYSLKSGIMPGLLTKIEKHMLRRSALSIFVSNSMKLFYERKYGLTIKNYSIMPCYNRRLNIDAIAFNERYNEASFVYAGGLFAWQSVDRMLSIYADIEKALVGANLTILTHDVTVASNMLFDYNIGSGKAKFVALDKLDEELSKFKYGFLIREDNIVNRVSTPTKMNSYLANGVMPIYTDVINDFEEHVNLNDYCIKFSPNENDKDIVSIICAHHGKSLEYTEFIDILSVIFDTYYSDEKNIQNIRRGINSVFSSVGNVK